MIWISTLFVFAASLCVAAAIASAMAPTSRQRRLAAIAHPDFEEELERESETGLLDTQQSWWMRILTPLAGGASQTGSDDVDPLRLRLTRAGYRSRSAVTQFVGGRILLALGLPVLVWLSPLPGLVSARFEIFVPFFALAIGYIGPSYWLDKRTRARQEEIERNLPAALDLMVVCVEAGLGLVQSVHRVGREMALQSPVLSQEFILVALESRTGRSNAAALRNLAQRTGVREVSVLVAMLTQTERFGTNLANSLRVHCDTMRVQRLQRAEAMGAKAPLKMLFPTSLILLALLILIIGLAAIRASQTLGG
jgi:tight adherence protein C